MDVWPVLGSAFLFLSVPVGIKTPLIQGLLAVVCILIFISVKDKNEIYKELIKISIIFIPWIIYLLLRCDFSDQYALKKLSLILGMQYLSILFIIVAYNTDRNLFNRYFFVFALLLTIFNLLIFFASPQTVYYTDAVQRLSTEFANSISLARSFAIGAVCILMIKISISMWIKLIFMLPFVIGIYMTGTRGPMIALAIIVAFEYFHSIKKGANFVIKTFIAICLIIPLTIITYDHLEKPIKYYFDRGYKKGVIAESGRDVLFREALIEFTSSPYIGVGLGKYSKKEQENKPQWSNSVKANSILIRNYPHNIVLEILTELGLVGIILFIVLLMPGRWLIDFGNPYLYLFLLSFIFAATSFDITGNGGVFIFGYLARIESNKRRAAGIVPAINNQHCGVADA